VRFEDVATYAVLGLVGVRLVSGLRHSLRGRGRSTVVELVRGIRWRHVWPVPLVLTAVATLASLLVQIPGLSFGWWTALGGAGNPIAGSSTTTTGTLWEWLLPLVFVGLVTPTLPLFALAEERIFRTGAEDWSTRRRIWKTLQFGLVHALIGIPIGAALAISLGGAYFMRVYLNTFAATRSPKEATHEAARAHTAYNAVIMTVVLLLAVTTAFG
jgi:hypothetical protein